VGLPPPAVASDCPLPMAPTDSTPETSTAAAAVASYCPLPMAPAASTPATSTAVYVAAVPLQAPKGPAQLLLSGGYSLGLWDLQHFMVPPGPIPGEAACSPLLPSLLNADAFAMVRAYYCRRRR
jgi:hypothetical protein